MKLLKRVKEFIKKFSLISPEEGLVAGVSGGPDSVFLIHILMEMDFKKVIIAHLNHRLRGEDADMDEIFVRHLSQKLMLPLYVGREDIKKFIKEKGYSIEEGARIKRFEFLKNVKRKEGMDKIVLGHNFDDSVETTVMNFIRGSGLKGLSGIPPKHEDVIHPILPIKREEILTCLKEKKIDFRIDKTNLSTDYLRNKIRNFLIPLIEKEFNKNFKERVWSLSEIVKTDDEYLDKIADGKIKELVKFENGLAAVKVEPFKKLHLSIKRRIIRKIIEHFNLNLREYSLKNIDDVVNLFNKTSGKRIELPQGIDAIKEYKEVIFKIRKDGVHLIEREILIPGETRISGILIETSIQDEWKKTPERFVECFDMDRLKIPLRIRLPRKGEKFIPLGMKGKKKLKEFFIDRKVPGSVRWNVPVIVDRDDEIVWVVGLRISDKFKITDLTKRILCIKIKLEDNRWRKIFKRF